MGSDDKCKVCGEPHDPDERHTGPTIAMSPETFKAACHQAKADARRAALEEAIKRMDRFASGHHFAGDLAGEKSFRRCMGDIRALLDDAGTTGRHRFDAPVTAEEWNAHLAVCKGC